MTTRQASPSLVDHPNFQPRGYHEHAETHPPRGCSSKVVAEGFYPSGLGSIPSAPTTFSYARKGYLGACTPGAAAPPPCALPFGLYRRVTTLQRSGTGSFKRQSCRGAGCASSLFPRARRATPLGAKTGSSSVWKSARFGSDRSQVQILFPRPFRERGPSFVEMDRPALSKRRSRGQFPVGAPLWGCSSMAERSTVN